jgi:hypothetical protein
LNYLKYGKINNHVAKTGAGEIVGIPSPRNIF